MPSGSRYFEGPLRLFLSLDVVDIDRRRARDLLHHSLAIDRERGKDLLLTEEGGRFGEGLYRVDSDPVDESRFNSICCGDDHPVEVRNAGGESDR
jgi:hypothetical protein